MSAAMARQQSISDAQILEAAVRVIFRRGHDAFTLSEVAAEVGLSRAAVILRFKGTQALKITSTAYIVDRFVQSMQSLPTVRSGDGLLDLVAFIGRMITRPGTLTAFMRTYHANVKDKELARLEFRRVEALRCAIAVRMPPMGIAHESAVTAFLAHLGGSLIQWEAQTEVNALTYLVERTKEWLTLAGVAYDRSYSGARLRTGAALAAQNPAT